MVSEKHSLTETKLIQIKTQLSKNRNSTHKKFSHIIKQNPDFKLNKVKSINLKQQALSLGRILYKSSFSSNNSSLEVKLFCKNCICSCTSIKM